MQIVVEGPSDTIQNQIAGYSAMRCPECGGTVFDAYGMCLYCRNRDSSIKPTRPVPDRWKVPDEPPDSHFKAELKMCPSCQKKSFFWNPKANLWECLNRDCQGEETES